MESYYRPFDQLRTNELTVTRCGWFHPVYELTDGQFSYGKLSYKGWTQRSAVIETADTVWTVVPTSIFSRKFLININGGNVGEVAQDIWSRKTTVSMNNGFRALFMTKKLISRTYTLMNDEYGDIFNLKQAFWTIKKPFSISYDQTILKKLPDLPLLMLLGVHQALLRQQQAAAVQ